MRTSLLLLTLLLTGCPAWPSQHDDPADRSAELDEPFEIAVGETVTVDNALQIRFEGVAEDSRCPIGLMCVHAGRALVRLYLVRSPQRGGPQVTSNLMDRDARSVHYGGYHIMGGRLTPHPVADQPAPEEGAYRLELLVEEAR